MADKRITELVELTVPAPQDLLMVIDDPTGTPINKKMQLSTLFGNISLTTTNTSVDTALVNVSLASNVAHAANYAIAGRFINHKDSAVAGNVHLGLLASAVLTSNANIVSMCAGAQVTLDPGTTTNMTSNALAALVVDTAQTGTRGVAPSAFIAIGEGSRTTQWTQFLFDIGRSGTLNVSGNGTSSNNNTIFSNCATTTITHKLRIRVNGQTMWLCCANAL
jgi:hypothetical protein